MPRSRWQLDLKVENLAGVAVPKWPVTSGVPLPEGLVKKTDPLTLVDTEDRPVPLQWEPLAQWPDGTVKWALLDFLAGAPRARTVRFRLRPGRPAEPAERVRVSRAKRKVTINTGPLRLVLNPEEFRLFERVDVRGGNGRYAPVVSASNSCPGLLLRDARGTAYTSHRKPVRVRVERSGPLRATVAVEGEHLSRSGRRCFSFVVRLHAYAGCDFVLLEHRFLNDNETGNFTKIREVALVLEAADRLGDARIGGAAGVHQGKSGDIRLFQVDHTHYELSGASERGGARAPGSLSASTEAGTVTAVIRDFWQQWPKSLEIQGKQIRLGLCPTLEPKQYDGLEPLEKWYYLFRGASYMIKTGVAKSHEVWLRFSPDRPDEQAFCAAAQTPLVAAADPEWAIATGAWGDLVPAGDPRSRRYNKAAEKVFQLLLQDDEEVGHYGLLNWGDWFGERVYNWGNNEYDTGHALFLQFARTGDARYFHAGRRFARHMADVDILHAINEDYLNNGEIRAGYGLPVNVGAVYLHAVGHVAGYFPLKWAAKRFPKAYYYGDIHNLGHLWNEGMLENYYLSGDPWAKEAALQVADCLVQYSQVPEMTWWFGRDPHCGRVAGWPLLALCSAYQATGRAKYLRAARHIVEHALADQDKHCGGWIYSLYPGHCFCHLGHVGMATFITCVLLNGLIAYHQITGDERVAESIVRAVDFILADTWVEHRGEFHYTSCPASAVRPATGSMLRPIGYALKLAGKQRHREVLTKGLERSLQHLLDLQPGRAYGKTYAAGQRDFPRVLCYL